MEYKYEMQKLNYQYLQMWKLLYNLYEIMWIK